MPELPEVEAARRALEEHCVGKAIRRCSVADDPRVVDGGGVSPADFAACLVGKTILAALRKGKNLWLQLDSPPLPSFQFGMAGAIYIKGVAVTKYKRSIVSDTEEWPSKYSKVFVELNDGLEFSFTDKRRFAKVRLLDNPASVPPISELGPDALLEPMNVDGFIDSLSKKKIPIKALLLDQSYISGIGNWIADEVLYQARIHPLQAAATLLRAECETLHKCINQVIQHAVRVDADCNQFPIEWLFHFRWGKKSGKVIDKAVEVGADNSQYPSNWIFHFREMKPGKAIVDGKEIEFISVGGRTSAFVPELQKLNGATSKKISTKRLKETEDDQEEEENELSEQEAPRTRKKSGRTPVAKLNSDSKTTGRQRATKEIKESKKSKLRSKGANDRQSKTKTKKDEVGDAIAMEDGSSNARRQQ